jgi:hypothetical protein
MSWEQISFMNKKDLSALRRQFKTDSHYLELKQVYTVYMKKDNQNVLYAEASSFDMKGEAEQEIYLSNFKKLLTGGFNSKLFELAFNRDAPEGEGQAMYRTLLGAERDDFIDCCNSVVLKIQSHFNYDSDIVISFAGGKYNKPAGAKSRKGEEESLTGFDDTTYGFKFVMCSISKADDAKKGIHYSASTERFELNSALDKTVNFQSPMEGFMFPAFSDNCADINKIVYYTGKPNTRNELFLENVLCCKPEPTVKEEQEKFEELIRLVNGEKIKPEIMKNIYDAIGELIEANEDPDETITLDSVELKDIFESSGISNLDGFDDAFRQTADEYFVFKAASLVPGGSRSIKITSGVTDISVNTEDLGAIRQVINAKGRKCLQIELEDDAEINGIALETESL